MTIIISKNGEDAERVEKSSFDKEDYLQEYIYKNPESIPLYDIKEDIRLLILSREFPTNSGPIDAIGVDQYGELYIIETKLYKNPDKRTVIAQALDYGAALWKHSYKFDEFISSLNNHTQKVFKMSATEKISNFFNLEEEESMVVMEKVKDNLNEGIFHFVVLMDKLDNRLKDLILYVNQNSQFDIYAVELEYYKHKEYEIIIPKIYGTEVKKSIEVKSSGSSRRKWTEDEVINKAKETLNEEMFSAFTKLFDFSKEHADEVKFGSGTTRGSFGPVFSKICERTIFTVTTDGFFTPNFGWINGSDEAIKFRNQLLADLNSIGFKFHEKDLNKFPSVTPDELVLRLKDLMILLKKKFAEKNK